MDYSLTISLNPLMIDKFVWFRSIVKLDVVLEDTSRDFSFLFFFITITASLCHSNKLKCLLLDIKLGCVYDKLSVFSTKVDPMFQRMASSFDESSTAGVFLSVLFSESSRCELLFPSHMTLLQSRPAYSPPSPQGVPASPFMGKSLSISPINSFTLGR